MTSWLRHDDVTEQRQKFSLTESRIETETKLYDLENTNLELFVAIPGNERKVPLSLRAGK